MDSRLTNGMTEQDVGALSDNGVQIIIVGSHRLGRAGGSGLHGLDASILGGAGPPALSTGNKGALQDGILLNLPTADVVALSFTFHTAKR